MRLARLVAAGANRVLELDPDKKRKLRRVEGKGVTLEVPGPDLEFTLRVEEGRFVAGGDAAARIRTTPGGMVALLASGGQMAAGELEMRGDVEIARRFQELFSELDLDWEAPLIDILGVTLGHQLAFGLRRGARFARRVGSEVEADVADYLRFESDHMVRREEAESFYDEVDDLRDRVARLEQKIQRG